MTTTLQHTPDDQAPRPPKVRTKAPGSKSIFDPAIIKTATVDALKKLNPRTMMRNPVMFIVEVGSVLTTYLFIRDFSDSDSKQNAFAGLVAAWLWFTVLFANFAEAMAEGRGKAGRSAPQDAGRHDRHDQDARRDDHAESVVGSPGRRPVHRRGR